MAELEMTYELPDEDEVVDVDDGAAAPQAAARGRVPPVREVRLRRRRRRTHHRARPGAARPLLGEPVRHALLAHPRLRPDPRQRRGRGRRGRRDGEPGRVRDPLAGARGPSRRGRRGARALGARQGVVVAAAACSTRSRRTRARSTTTTRCSTTTPASCSTPRRASASAHALGDNKAVILRNHGLLTVGHSVDEAAWWFITMERTCQAQLLAEAAGTPVLIDAAAGGA